jgi:hypothetical protein
MFNLEALASVCTSNQVVVSQKKEEEYSVLPRLVS